MNRRDGASSDDNPAEISENNDCDNTILGMNRRDGASSDDNPAEISEDNDCDNTILGMNRRDGTSSDENPAPMLEDIIMLEIVQNMVDAGKNKRRLIGTDLLRRCLQPADSGTVTIMRQYVDGVDDEGLPNHVGPHLDMWDELRKFNERAKESHPDLGRHHMLEIVQNMVDAGENKRRLIGTDLLSRCLQLADSGTVTIMKQYVDGVDDEGLPNCVGPHLDM